MGNSQNPEKHLNSTYILLGPQGSGKGTQGNFLKQHLDAHYLVVGDLCRQVAEAPTSLGRRVKALVDHGGLLSDELLLEIFKTHLVTLPKNQNIIFDGIPRSIIQAQMLDKILSELNILLPKVILIEISRQEALHRLLTRKVCAHCYQPFWPQDKSYQSGICEHCGSKLITRKDDNQAAINYRLDQYYQETPPIIEYYQKNNRIITINGEQRIENVWHDIKEAI